MPKQFEFADSLPRSPLGKLLKRELRKAANGQKVVSSESRLDKVGAESADANGNGNGNGSDKKSAGKKEVA